MSSTDDARTTREHPIGERRILSNDGELPRRLTVFCETRGEAVEVASCGECSQCVGIRLPGPGVEAAVRCVPGPSDRALRVLGMRVRVSAVMSRNVMCVTDDLSAESAAVLLLKRGQHATTVVNAEGRPVGLISKTDLLRAVSEASGAEQAPDDDPRAAPMDPSLHAIRTAGPSVADAMTPLVFAIPGHAELIHAVALMAAEGVLQLPVISDEGEVEGLLTALDIMSWIARFNDPPTTDAL